MSTPDPAAQPFTLLRTNRHKPQVRPGWIHRPRKRPIRRTGKRKLCSLAWDEPRREQPCQ
jgi:hypothetical protein